MVVGFFPQSSTRFTGLPMYTYSQVRTSLLSSPLQNRSTKIWYITAPLAQSGV